MSEQSLESIGVIGLGLIGGSLAKALKLYKKEVAITAFDPNGADMKRAVNEGAVDIDAKGDLTLFAGVSSSFFVRESPFCLLILIPCTKRWGKTR